MKPIKLDLRNLTDAMIADARNNTGECSYMSPCIVGAIAPQPRLAFD